MADYPPYMNSYGLVSKILTKIKEAKTPDRFTQDYMANTLGYSSGAAKSFIPVMKRLGLLSSDGVPSELYKEFRNADHSKTAMGKAIRQGYSQLYDRNENVHELDKKGLEGLVVQATGLDQGSGTLRAIIGTFEAFKGFATFGPASAVKDVKDKGGKAKPLEEEEEDTEDKSDNGGFRLGLSYTINLVLPKTEDVAVFNAIFKALRENLLRK